ncbi:class II aldolase/adducin family protein [Albidovulum sediminicola]|uniref:Class II aldolase/adducin family protein n=1 Tax=Albidovulum sediminicola TaxID=2984331 RepID=A0ABT2Z1V1_9RHOB|nr:class II aldolase/adducin family protein [Defluviimonas sp. WL0075]MCV2865094.1 class II aldolase/adducin family protein [Defluviimonas sp. WL0075]
MAHREDICAAMVALVDSGLNRGASGNISVRDGEHMLITPSGVPPRDILPNDIARMPLAGDGEWEGPLAPSVEWRFHRDILNARPEMNAVVHTHAQWCTALAVARKSIPAVHYMIAAFGGSEIRCSDYATYGTPELSAAVLAALKNRAGCLMANHGMVVGGENLTKALWLANELEALAHQHFHSLLIGGAHVLSDEQIAETAQGFKSYGAKARGESA